ncbi:MAG: hypothetical protein ACW98X_18665 [Promethearchaeota archaeon]|jgi:hypothetical protein
MKNVLLVERTPSVEEYQTLRRAINWKIVDETACKNGLQGSLYCVCAELNGEIIGMARILFII